MSTKIHQRIFNTVWHVVEGASLALFTIMLLLTIAQVLFRYVLNISVPWTEEAARWLFVWQIFLGSALMLREKGHLKVTMIRDKLPLLAQKIVDFLLSILSLIFMVGICVGSLQMISSVKNITAGSFNISVTYLYLVMPISMVLMALLYGKKVIEDVLVFFRKQTIEEKNKE